MIPSNSDLQISPIALIARETPKHDHFRYDFITCDHLITPKFLGDTLLTRYSDPKKLDTLFEEGCLEILFQNLRIQKDGFTGILDHTESRDKLFDLRAFDNPYLDKNDDDTWITLDKLGLNRLDTAIPIAWKYLYTVNGQWLVSQCGTRKFTPWKPLQELLQTSNT